MLPVHVVNVINARRACTQRYSTLFVWLSVTSLLVSFHIFYYDNIIISVMF